eukprot:20176-Pyramimonas_sp.AAC.1
MGIPTDPAGEAWRADSEGGKGGSGALGPSAGGGQRGARAPAHVFPAGPLKACPRDSSFIVDSALPP